MRDKKYIIDDEKLIKEWDYEKNILNPSKITLGSGQKIWWICDKGHRYSAVVYSRIHNNSGCPYCAGQKVLEGYNDLATTHPELVKEWDYEKNKILPNSISKGSGLKVWWICSKNHSYEAEIKNRVHGTKCPYCNNQKVLEGFNDLYTWCKKNNKDYLINEFDSKKNKFSMKEISSKSGKEVWWICPNGHSYSASVSHRTNMNTGCGICSHKVFRTHENDLITTNPEIAEEWDYAKNKITPDKVMAGSNNKKYWFICKKGHSYSASLLNRKKGRNCPICSKERHVSFPEKTIYFYLKKYLKNVIENYHAEFLGTKEIDIFLPKYKIGIEYDGNVWHKSFNRDLEKDKICYENGILLVRIRERGCKIYESNSIMKYIKQDSINELEEAIKFIFEIINDRCDKSFNVSININEDRMKILEIMELYEKNNSIASKFPDIEKYWDKEKNGLITPYQISHCSKKSFYLKCSEGHSWEKTAQNLRVLQCPYCFGRKILKGYNDLFTTNPELKKIWSKNNKLNPYELSYGSQKNALWICDICKNEYEMKIHNKVKGHRCSICHRKK